MDPQQTQNQNPGNPEPKSPADTPAQPNAGDHPLAGKILFIVIALLIAGAVAATYWRIVVKKDYIVQAQTDCDPTTENCFIWKCDPNSTVEGEACTGDEENDIWYYKNFRRNAKNISLCDPNDENCTALTCENNEADCSEELCTAQNVPEGEECNDPVQYNIDNPEEDEECAPDDEECLSAQEEGVECEEGDEECAAAQEEECAADDQECLDAQDESQDTEACTPDDTECQQENGSATDEGTGTNETGTPAPSDQ